jgi:serine/threonine-protein kinase
MISKDSPKAGMPEHIGRYRVLERIGRGAMGVVYRAGDEAMGREVAIKVLVADLEEEPEIRTRFLREAEAAARLSHPNVIKIFDVGEEHERFYIVMELLRGATLKDYLTQSDAAPLERKLDLMIQLCAGLGAAHHASIYHRDIKPGNIFVRHDGSLKILDFGVARVASSNMTAAGFVIGTPDYMSPEQARGNVIDARSDIFSAGGVFYFMVTGRKPFAAPDLPTIFRQVQFEDPIPFQATEAPPALARVIMKALSKDKALRHQSCQELMSELIEVRADYVSDAQGTTAFRRDMPEPEPATADVDEPDARETAASIAQPPTDDTVDYLPFPLDNDQTVTLPPAPARSFTDRVGSFVSAAIERIWQSGTQNARRQALRRKE